MYLVVLPQTHLTVSADRVDLRAQGRKLGDRHGRAVARGDELLAHLDEAIAAAAEAGADVTAAEALRDDAAVHLASASAGVAGAADQVLTVTPSSWNDGDGQSVIENTRAAVRTAHAEIKDGIEDGHAAIEAVRAALDAVGGDA